VIRTAKFSLLPTWLNHRALRSHVVRWALDRMFCAVGKKMVGVGQLANQDVHRILVLRPNHRLGNILLLTPLIAELERAFTGAEIDVLVAGEAATDVLEGFFSIGRIYLLPRYVVRHLVATVSTIVALRRARYDLAIDPSTDSPSSRLILALASPRHILAVPDPGNAAWARVMFSAPRHCAKLPVFLLRHALADDQSVDEINYPTLNIQLALVERRSGRRALATLMHAEVENRLPITLGVFANATGAKRYSETWWLQFLAAISANHPEYIIVEFLATDGISRLGHRFPVYYSNSPRKIASVISNVTYFISGHCGVMHLASATSTPTVGLFSATDPTMYEPYGHFSRALNTGNKTPEDVAQAAIRVLKAIESLADLENNANSRVSETPMRSNIVGLRPRCERAIANH
jgi:heptosyltransferase III